MLVLQVDCGDMRNADNFGIVGIDNFGIVGKAGKELVMLVLQVDCGDMRNADNFGIVGEAS